MKQDAKSACRPAAERCREVPLRASERASERKKERMGEREGEERGGGRREGEREREREAERERDGIYRKSAAPRDKGTYIKSA